MEISNKNVNYEFIKQITVAANYLSNQNRLSIKIEFLLLSVIVSNFTSNDGRSTAAM
jgi:hypothetical protein